MTAPKISNRKEGAEYSFTYLIDEADQPALGIVEAVAWVKGTNTRELEPLGDVIDTESLRAMVRGSTLYRSSRQSRERGASVTFEYEGCLVTVDSERIAIEAE